MTWAMAMACAKHEHGRTGKRVRVRGYKTPGGAWRFSVLPAAATAPAVTA